MSNNSILISIIVIVFFSCNNRETEIKTENIGNYNEIILVINDQIWDGITGETLKEIFEKEIDGVPQSEQLFDLIQINESEFSRIFKTHKNIIFVSEEIQDSYAKNKWAKNQTVIYLNSNLQEEEFRRNCIKALNFFDRKELESIKYSYQKKHNKKATKFIKNEFDIEIYLPTEYSVPIKGGGIFVSDFHSFNKKEDLLKYIIVFKIDQSRDNIQNVILRKTDSILQLYVSGDSQNSFVQIDGRIPVKENNGVYRGMWTLINGFMAGPFILRVYEKENKIIVALGLVFYPNKNKRKFVRTFEAIL